MSRLIVVLLLGFVATSLAVSGVDFSTRVSTSAFKCLKTSHEFVVTRGYQSIGRVDPSAKANIADARAAGFKTVDVYLFPCVSCGNPAAQVRALVAGLQGADYNTIWFDIEIFAWKADKAENQRFISELIAAGKTTGKKLGMYTNLHNWENIVGANWAGAASLPLWYADYDHQANFNDFKPFGGWARPTIKQYAGTTTVCGVGVDLNWHP